MNVNRIDHVLKRFEFKVIAPKIVIPLLLVLASYPILIRSLWLDEVMLFSNYPLSSIRYLFQPLPLYDQATIPLYSLIMSAIGGQPSVLIRIESVYLLSAIYLFVLLKNESSWWKHLFAVAVLLAFRNCLMMMSELKHYSLEMLGVLILVMWFARKDESDGFSMEDIFILSLGLVCGIVTIVVAAIVVGAHFAIKFFLKRSLSIKELVNGGAFVCAVAVYFLVIRRCSSIQTANYPWVYQTQGVIKNLKIFALAVSQLMGTNIAGITVVSFVMLLIGGFSKPARKIVLISSVVVVVIVVLAAIGVYPARSNRHITWLYSVFAIVIFCGALAEERKYFVFTIGKIALIVAVVVIGGRNVYSYWTYPSEGTENRQAIEYLESKSPAWVGVWCTGQPAIQYYRTFYPGLNKHHYFGLINDTSFANPEANTYGKQVIDIEMFRSKPGAWGRTGTYLLSANYRLQANTLLSEAPKDTSFYIFASTYSLHDSDPFYRSHVDALNSAFTEYGCAYEIEKELHLAAIYKVKCSENKQVEGDAMINSEKKKVTK